MNTTMILGGPGTGKTHSLLDIVEDELSGGASDPAIAFVSFTKKAVGEAISRGTSRLGCTKEDFPYFRTIHSLCFQALGLRRADVMGRSHYDTLSEILGVKILGRDVVDDDISLAKGDRMLALEGYAKMTQMSLEQAWSLKSEGEFSWYEFLRFCETYTAYKTAHGLIDFNDMLVMYADREPDPLPVDAAIIDEAQDLTPLQWRVVDLAFASCQRMYVAGDDDQAIYGWSGADTERFLGMVPDETRVLPVSHRLPENILDYSQRITARISNRFDKPFTASAPGGLVSRCEDMRELDLENGTWLMLARNLKFLRKYEDECSRRGLVYDSRFGCSVKNEDVVAIRRYEAFRKGEPFTGSELRLVVNRIKGHQVKLAKDRMYSMGEVFKRDPGIWHDAFTGIPLRKREYYLLALRSGRKITNAPLIRLDTIHGAKGGEADNVVLATDVSPKSEESMRKDPDDEWRVFYVGATRARKNLFVLSPRTGCSIRL